MEPGYFVKKLEEEKNIQFYYVEKKKSLSSRAVNIVHHGSLMQ